MGYLCHTCGQHLREHIDDFMSQHKHAVMDEVQNPVREVFVLQVCIEHLEQALNDREDGGLQCFRQRQTEVLEQILDREQSLTEELSLLWLALSESLKLPLQDVRQKLRAILLRHFLIACDNANYTVEVSLFLYT